MNIGKTEADPSPTQMPLCERVLGVTNPTDVENSLTTAYFTLTGRHITAAALLEEAQQLQAAIATVDEHNAYTLPPDRGERSVSTRYIRALFVDREPNRLTTILNRWPVYADQYERFGPASQHQATSAANPRRALLIGSLSALSSRAFVALAEDVYGVAPGQAHIIDPRSGEDKKRQGTFIHANGLSMPYRNDSMSIVQTNLLLHMLLIAKDKPVEPDCLHNAASTLFNEVYRVMRSDGYLLMHELAPGYRDEEEGQHHLLEKFASNIESLLTGTGYIIDSIEPTWKLSGDFLFDSSRQFNNYGRIPYPGVFAICAHKPAHVDAAS